MQTSEQIPAVPTMENFITDDTSMPNNESRLRYQFYQFVIREHVEELKKRYELKVVSRDKTGAINDSLDGFLTNPRYGSYAEELLQWSNRTVTGPLTAFNGRFVLAKRFMVKNEVPSMFLRLTPRDTSTEPPIMEEIIELNEGIEEPHPRAAQYPAKWSRAMVAYAEDPFWLERTVPLPAGLKVPPRPYDYFDIDLVDPPPEDFDYMAPPGNSGIEIPREAYDLFEERRSAHQAATMNP